MFHQRNNKFLKSNQKKTKIFLIIYIALIKNLYQKSILFSRNTQ